MSESQPKAEVSSRAAYHLKSPNSAQRTADIFAGCLSYLQHHFGENWLSGKIIELPVILRSSWDGPTDLAEHSVSASRGQPPIMQESLVNGFNAEATVFSALKRHLQSASCDAILIHSPMLTMDHLQLINQMLDIQLPLDNPCAKPSKRSVAVEKASADSNAAIADTRASKSLATKMTLEQGSSSKEKRATAISNADEAFSVPPNFSMELGDVLVISKQFGILIVEVKASKRDIAKAHEQLAIAAGWIRTILVALAEDAINRIPVRAAVALPNTSIGEIAKKERKPGICTYFTKEDFTTTSDALSRWLDFKRLKVAMDDQLYVKLAATALVLRTAVFQKGCPRESSLRLRQDDLSMSVASACIIDKLTSQSYLGEALKIQAKSAAKAKSKARAAKIPSASHQGQTDSPKVLAGLAPLATPKRSKDATDHVCAAFRQVMFLTPYQTYVLNSPLKRLQIEGFASTGKTLLLQLKIISVLQDVSDPIGNVVVLLPMSLVALYCNCLRSNLANYEKLAKEKRLLVCGLREFVKLSLTEIAAAHVFLDEVRVITSLDDGVRDEMLARLEVAAQSGNYFWTTSDGLQNVVDIVSLARKEKQTLCQELLMGPPLCRPDNITVNSDLRSNARPFLTSALRCTAEVYESWQRCIESRILKLGHNVHGRNVIHHRTDFPSCFLNTIQSVVEQAMQLEGWAPEDVGVIIIEMIYGLSHLLKRMVSEQLGRSFGVTTADCPAANCITVDLQLQTHSHEWPCVIVVVPPDPAVKAISWQYVAQSLCLASLVVIECFVFEPDRSATELLARSFDFLNRLHYRREEKRAFLVGRQNEFEVSSTPETVFNDSKQFAEVAKALMEEVNSFHSFILESMEALSCHTKGGDDFEQLAMTFSRYQEFVRCNGSQDFISLLARLTDTSQVFDAHTAREIIATLRRDLQTVNSEDDVRRLRNLIELLLNLLVHRAKLL